MTDMTSRVRVILDGLTTAWKLHYTLQPYEHTDADTRRAMSDDAPLVSDTCTRRWAVVELATLRVYADAVASAIAALPQVNVVTDAWQYDNRTADATVVAFQDMTTGDYPLWVVSLRQSDAWREEHAEDFRDRLMDARTGDMLADALNANRQLEEAAFALSRQRWAENNPATV